MSIEYVIQYNLAVKDALARFFEVPHMWDVRPFEAVKFSAADKAGCDATVSSDGLKEMPVREFLQILFSALPRNGEYGNIVGFARMFFTQLGELGDYASLVDLTNYIFKSLALSNEKLEPLLAERTLRLMRELHFWANREIHALRSAEANYRLLPESLDRAFSGASVRELPRDLVFIFLTSAYMANLEYWLDLYQRHDATAERLFVLVIGDDFAEPMEGWLARRGATGAHVLNYNPPMKLGACGNGTNLDFLWYVKIHVVKFFLELGSRVVYSDLDAYWIKNYFSVRDAVIGDTGADVIVSMTYDMPRCAVIDQGFTPCAGFFSADPTAGGKAILADWCKMTEIMFDDQIALAEFLFRHAAAWQPCHSALAAAIVDVLTDQRVPARIAALDGAVARRVGLPDPSTIGSSTIWHPRWVMAPDQHKDAIHLVSEAQP